MITFFVGRKKRKKKKRIYKRKRTKHKPVPRSAKSTVVRVPAEIRELPRPVGTKRRRRGYVVGPTSTHFLAQSFTIIGNIIVMGPMLVLVRTRPNQRTQTERHARRQSLRSAAEPRPPMCRRRRRILSLRRTLRRIPGIGPLLRRLVAEIGRRRRRHTSIRAPASPSVGFAASVVARGEHHREPRRRRGPFLARFPTRGGGLRLVRSAAEDVREDPESAAAVSPLLRRSSAVSRGGFSLRRAVEQPLSAAVAVGFPARDVGGHRAREIDRRRFLLRLGLPFSLRRCVFS